MDAGFDASNRTGRIPMQLISKAMVTRLIMVSSLFIVLDLNIILLFFLSAIITPQSLFI
jgi:NADH:ubiquinone oxidoreductase subunit 3 (subunit A)